MFLGCKLSLWLYFSLGSQQCQRMRDLTKHNVHLPFTDIRMNPWSDSKNERRKDLSNLRHKRGVTLSILDMGFLGKTVLKFRLLLVYQAFLSNSSPMTKSAWPLFCKFFKSLLRALYFPPSFFFFSFLLCSSEKEHRFVSSE